MSVSYEGENHLRLDGLENLLKAVKAKPVMGRIGILGQKNVRDAQRSAARKLVKRVGATAKSQLGKQVIKEKIARGRFGSGNATVGAAHEFGAPRRNLPKRSFLREPLMDRLQKELDAKGAFSKEEQAEILRTKSLRPWTLKVVIVGENIVKGAFDSDGYGKWKPVTEKTQERKTTGNILVETTQLRDSITSDVRASE